MAHTCWAAHDAITCMSRGTSLCLKCTYRYIHAGRLAWRGSLVRATLGVCCVIQNICIGQGLISASQYATWNGDRYISQAQSLPCCRCCSLQAPNIHPSTQRYGSHAHPAFRCPLPRPRLLYPVKSPTDNPCFLFWPCSALPSRSLCTCCICMPCIMMHDPWIVLNSIELSCFNAC